MSDERLTLRRAVLLGLVQGPAELLPVSSSGHLVLLGSHDRAFEVALHAGTAAALAVALREEVLAVAAGLDRRRAARIALTLGPAVVAGGLLGRPLERRLGHPRTVAVAQVAGGLGMLLADRAPARRGHAEAGARDALLIGLAQACALVPGVSRNGATLTAARLLGFRREAASRMSRHAALPVIAGASMLKLLRLGGRAGAARPAAARSRAAPLLLGTAAAFASGVAAARLVPRIDRMRSYAPFALYRIALGLAFLARGRTTSGRWA